jgi:phosphoglycolate phosphatase-like HAD superfamily hydrolase
MNGNKNTVIFDFDGTIADTLKPLIQIVNSLSDEYKFEKITPQNQEELRALRGREVLKKSKIPFWKVFFFVRKVRKLLFEKIKSIEAFPGISSVVNFLRAEEIKVYAVSTNSKENIQTFFNQHKIAIDHIYITRFIFSKSRAINRMLSKEKVDPAKAIYIGDEVSDYEACKKSGVDFIAVTWGFNSVAAFEKVNPRYLANTPKELFEILEKLIV